MYCTYSGVPRRQTQRQRHATPGGRPCLALEANATDEEIEVLGIEGQHVLRLQCRAKSGGIYGDTTKTQPSERQEAVSPLVDKWTA